LSELAGIEPTPTRSRRAGYARLNCSATGDIFTLLILLKGKRDQLREISKYKARLVMDGSGAQIGVDVFDTFAVILHQLSITQLFDC
jgi:hypothetical protein